MSCILCKSEEDNIRLLGIDLCKICFQDISDTDVFNEKYDYYKEIVKLILKNYIYERTIINPIE